MTHVGTFTETTRGSTVDPTGSCPYCSRDGYYVYHFGRLCPKIKAIEYYPDGTVKKVEFHPAPPAPVWGKTITGYAPTWG